MSEAMLKIRPRIEPPAVVVEAKREEFTGAKPEEGGFPRGGRCGLLTGVRGAGAGERHLVHAEQQPRLQPQPARPARRSRGVLPGGGRDPRPARTTPTRTSAAAYRGRGDASKRCVAFSWLFMRRQTTSGRLATSRTFSPSTRRSARTTRRSSKRPRSAARQLARRGGSG